MFAAKPKSISYTLIIKDQKGNIVASYPNYPSRRNALRVADELPPILNNPTYEIEVKEVSD